ncbi:MAG TPA: AarF/ABC1/UbiB kinase family protein [bacterium]|nr:AarF/ABC1/UbiB kinase family protein [bacterium]
MSTKSTKTNALTELLATLAAREDTPVPQGRLSRMTRMVATSMGAGLSAVSGRLRGRGSGGLDSIDIDRIKKLVANLGELKGLAMKMGQIMSYIDDTLSPETRELLALLQTQSQPSSWETVSRTLRENLPEKAEELLVGMDRPPVSVASIGQVHHARLADGRELAVKILHPGVREALVADFSTAKIGPVVARLMLPGGVETMKGFIDEMRERMLEECDYTLEAKWQTRFGKLYADDSRVIVPRVWEKFSTSAVLATDWEEGLSFEDFLASDPSPELRNAMGRTLFDVYFGTLYRHGIFHADPHPGNYAFRDDGTLVLYDFGCMREFDKQSVRALAELAHAVADDREAAVRQAFTRIGGQIPDDPASYKHVRELLRGFFRPLLTPGVQRIDAGVNLAMGEVIRDKRMLMRLKLPGKLMFLFRIRFGLYAVLARLGSQCDWAAMERALADQAL